jgi:deazaflavin-dependent oxidoreductase (nitroreductase family)
MAASRTIPYVDPNKHRGSLYRAWVAFIPTPVGMWLSRHVVWKLDPWLLRATGGRIGFGLILRTALLETRGARSGSPRRTAVVYFNDGDRLTIIASKLGAPEHPSWFHNLQADPDVVFGGHPFRARLIEDEESRTRLWALADRVLPAFAVYRTRAARAGRTIPIIQLLPR